MAPLTSSVKINNKSVVHHTEIKIIEKLFSKIQGQIKLVLFFRIRRNFLEFFVIWRYSGFSVSGRRGKLDIRISEIPISRVQLSKSKHPNIDAIGYRSIRISKQSDIEASGYQNIKFHASKSGYPEPGVLLLY